MARATDVMHRLFGRDKALIGMVHVRALAGTPRGSMALAEITKVAADEARLLADAGFDALLIENMHDAPYLRERVGAEIVAGMTRAGVAVREAVDLPLGVQVLAAANIEAVAVAHAIGAAFVRVENFVFAHVADEGLMAEAGAGRLLRYRRQIGADDIAIFADIKKKHAAHALTADVTLAETAEAAQGAGAEGVIVTGSATGKAAAINDVRAAAGACELPVFVGSGATAESVGAILEYAHGVIVGSALKVGGNWANEMDPKAATEFVRSARRQ